MKNKPEGVIQQAAEIPRKLYHTPKILSRQTLEAVAADCGKTDLVTTCPDDPPPVS